jgi:hypothetical protein
VVTNHQKHAMAVSKKTTTKTTAILKALKW